MANMIPLPDWESFGNPACAGEDTRWWYATDYEDSIEDNLFTGAEVNRLAINICNSCEILNKCRDWGIKHEKHGIWGGMTPWARRKYRKTHNILLVEPISIIRYLGVD
jgi:hypothetical protein